MSTPVLFSQFEHYVLGPVLILVFIDDLEKGLMSDVLKLADDTKIFRRVDSEDDRDVLQ